MQKEKVIFAIYTNPTKTYTENYKHTIRVHAKAYIHLQYVKTIYII